MEISAGHLVPAGNFCQSSRTSRKLLPANSYQPEDYASHLVPAGTVLYRQMPPRTTISYWYEMVEKMSTRIFGYEMSGTRGIRTAVQLSSFVSQRILNRVNILKAHADQKQQKNS
ncbi:hypothetical protein DAPPUDRAFT_322106 [Daphnia pulex]|uniref:Uncharacterized protein n=1 Tax=Daphnia pulex TaxID=6669 RepID=E9GUY2_DAPPU|nr:hypothetical protein DAPPUDRAFT_322106 [Daphnia pulex]|eukprot:EFX76570.1 hypothetical protein DAPPUDRAFT_322106 [Daphnia pulex]